MNNPQYTVLQNPDTNVTVYPIQQQINPIPITSIPSNNQPNSVVYPINVGNNNDNNTVPISSNLQQTHPSIETKEYFSQPPPTTSYDDVSLLNPSSSTSNHQTVKQRLEQREYTTNIGSWISEAWELYKAQWVIFTIWTLVCFLVIAIPYVGIFLGHLLVSGFYIAVSDTIRPSSTNRFITNYWIFLMGFSLLIQLLIILILKSLLISLGLIFFILPGIYLSVVLSFVINVYLEYNSEGISMIDSFWVSGRVIHKQFWSMFGFSLIQYVLLIAGVLCFGFGVFVSFPVILLTQIVSFRDIFGFRDVYSDSSRHVLSV